MSTANKLTDLALRALKPKASSYLKSDGAGLNIKVYPNGRLQWLLRKYSQGKAMQIPLGDYPEVSLKQAREKAAKEAANFVDSRRYVKQVSFTFGELFQQWLANKAQLRANTLKAYKNIAKHLEPFNDRLLESIRPIELKQFADKLPPTIAPLTLNVVANIEIYANALGLIEVPKLQYVAKTLKPHKTEHVRSINYEELPNLFELASKCTLVRRDYYLKMLLIGMFTLLRAHELQSLKSSWIDNNAKVINLPSSIMKAKRPHTVPICMQLDFILSTMCPYDLIASRTSQDLNLYKRQASAFNALKITPLICPHGVRSLARTWLADQDFNFAASEMCLAHRVENATQQAYQRSDYLKQRRVIMQAWGDYVEECARPFLPEFFQ